jgi:hypothetical protein
MLNFRRKELLKPFELIVDEKETLSTQKGTLDTLKVHEKELFDIPGCNTIKVTISYHENEAKIVHTYADGHTWEYTAISNEWYAEEQVLRYMLKTKYGDLMKVLNRPDIKVDVELPIDKDYYAIIRNGSLDHIVYGDYRVRARIMMIDEFHSWEEEYADIDCD